MSFCPECGTKGRRTGPLAWLGAAFIGAGCLMWVPVIGWILLPVVALIGLVGAIVAASKPSFVCPECRKKWRA